MTRIHIKSGYKRAALNIEEYSDKNNFFNHYFPTPIAEKFIEEVASELQKGGGAHALSGAYGAGKSSLAIFAMHQLSASTKFFNPSPYKMSNKAADKHCSLIRKKGGVITICAVGASLPIAVRIITAAKQALADYKGSAPEALKSIASIDLQNIDNNKLVYLIKKLIDDSGKHKKAGVMLIIDEFGRHFERMVAQRDSSDLHLLQGLAEITGTRNNVFSFVVIQHYDLQHYVHYLLKNERIEWEKTRGRFKETLLENSAQDVADIATSFFVCKDEPSENNKREISPLGSCKKIYSFLGESYQNDPIKYWPLHPATILALTRLSANIGQNDRTVVGWITSDASSGFMQAARKSADWVRPSSLYDHFFSNLQYMPANAIWAKRVSEIYAAEERFTGDENAFLLLKTIAILNCVGGGSADENTLKACMPAKFPFENAMSFLLEKSLVIFRKHRGEYCVWRGSDYDVVGAISEAAEKINSFSFASLLNNEYDIPKITAHRYLIETGNMHTLSVEFIDDVEKLSLSKKGVKPRILVFITDNVKSIDISKIKVDDSNDIYAVISLSELKSYGLEIQAMRYLLGGDNLLQHEMTAKREIEQYLEFSEQHLFDMLCDKIFTHTDWFLENIKYDDLQSAVDKAINSAYSQSFKLRSELINRDYSNGAITAAMRLLCTAMVENADVKNLGFVKCPPQLMIYKALLQEKKIHIKDGDSYYLTFNPDFLSEDIQPVAKKIEEILCLNRSNSFDMSPISVQSVIDILAKPPYGVKTLPAIIICFACMLYNKNRLVVFEDKKYLFKWGRKEVQRFISSPSRFELSALSPEWIDSKLLSKYYKSITGELPKEDVSIISVARALLEKWEKFDQYSVKSDNVSENVKKFRRAISYAKSPSDMLFKTIPDALKQGGFYDSAHSQEKFFQSLFNVVLELERIPQDLKNRFANIIAKHFSSQTLEQAMHQARLEADKVLSAGRMYPLHRPFLLSLQKQARPEEWLEQVLISSMESPKKPQDWSDADEAQTEFVLRRNFLWLREATQALEESTSEEFIIASASQFSDTAEEAELQKVVKQIKKAFPRKSIEQVMLNLNYYLSREKKK